MKNKQKTIGVNPLDFYLSYNNTTDNNTDNNNTNNITSKENNEKAKSQNIDNLTLKVETGSVKTEENLEYKQENTEKIELKNSLTENSDANENIEKEKNIDINLTNLSVQEAMYKHIDMIETDQIKVPKERVTIHVPAELIDRVKNVVYWEPGLTLAAFAELALQRFLDELEKERGEPFPPRRRHKLFGGRPLK